MQKSASSRSHPPLHILAARDVSSSIVAAHERPAQGRSLDVAGSPSRRPQLQAPTSEALCQTPRRWPPVPGRPRNVPVPPTQQGADLHAVGAPLPPAYPAPVPVYASVAACDGVPYTPSSVEPKASRRDEAPTWTCLKECGYERSSYAGVKKHERRCQAPLHPTKQAPSAGPQAEQGSSDCSTAPESADSPAAVGGQGKLGARPDHVQGGLGAGGN